MRAVNHENLELLLTPTKMYVSKFSVKSRQDKYDSIAMTCLRRSIADSRVQFKPVTLAMYKYKYNTST